MSAASLCRILALDSTNAVRVRLTMLVADLVVAMLVIITVTEKSEFQDVP
jgi:hypothetical protein